MTDECFDREKRMKILFYGDSNTYGFDPRGPVPGRYEAGDIWVNIIKKRFPDTEIFEDGRNGRQIPSFDSDFEFLFKLMDRISPDILAVMLGSNDYLNMFKPSCEEVILKMDKALDKILDRFKGIRILLIAPPYIKTKDMCGMSKYDTSDGRLSMAFKMLSQKRGFYFADAGDLPLAFDGVHLSILGHKRLAEKMMQNNCIV